MYKILSNDFSDVIHVIVYFFFVLIAGYSMHRMCVGVVYYLILDFIGPDMQKRNVLL